MKKEKKPPVYPKSPIKLDKAWERLSVKRRRHYESMGFTREVWENNRSETISGLGLHDWDFISTFGDFDKPSSRVLRSRILTGDRADQPLDME